MMKPTFLSPLLLPCIILTSSFSFRTQTYGRIISDISVYPTCHYNTTSNANTDASSCCEGILSSNHNNNHGTQTCGILRLDDNHSWSLRSGDGVYGNISVTIPGDIITDLYEAKIIPYPFYNNNFLDTQHVWMGEEYSNEQEGQHQGLKANNYTSINSQLNIDSNLRSDDNHHYHHQRKNNDHEIKNNIQTKQNYLIPGLKARKRNWIYERNFTLLDASLDHNHHHQRLPEYVLVVEGIKMGASIEINGVHIGNVTNQFRRYIFPIPTSVWNLGIENRSLPSWKLQQKQQQQQQQLISVSFLPDIDTQGRYMACSGGWDWAPYTQNAEASCLESRRSFTFGIVKPIYIATIRNYDEPAIVHVVPKIHYLGDLDDESNSNLSSNSQTSRIHGVNHGRYDQEENGDFKLEVDVHLMTRSHDDHIFDNIRKGNRKDQKIQNGQVIFRAPFFKDDIIMSTDDGDNEYTKKTTSLHGSVIVITLSVIVERKDIQLWWPRGIGGKPKLYLLQVAYRNKVRGTMTKWVNNQIGFRTIKLVTANEFDVDGGSSKADEGNRFHGMYFRINGKLINSRGANVIPMSQLEGFHDEVAHRVLVESAEATNMNMLRVWGGGMILPNSFYEACDEKGILVFHDLMFVEEQSHSPKATKDIEEEIKCIVRSLMPHPSIVLWNGCNECERQTSKSTGTDIYSEFVMRIVAEEDPTRPVWPNSPSKNAWKSGVYTETGLPNGNRLSYWDYEHRNDNSIEVHGPYAHGSSLEQPFSVNGHPSHIPFDTKIPLKVNTNNIIGPQFTNHFVSEFGASVFSSFESMAPTMSQNNWGIHGDQEDLDKCTVVFENYNDCKGSNVMSQRNYPCDDMIQGFFGAVSLNHVGESAFRHQLYLCMIAQSLWMKGEIEIQRNQNIFGSLIWQLNENWPTGGWGLVEYGSHAGEKGQVIGGRWKPLMYLLKRSLFRNVIATCGAEGSCYCRNDGDDFTGTIIIERYDFTTSLVTALLNKPVHLKRGDSIEYFTISMEEIQPCCNAVVLHVIDNEDNELMGENISLFATPKDLTLPQDISIIVKSIVQIKDRVVEVTLESNRIVLYVVLSCGIEGQFEDNAFLMQPEKNKAIRFTSAQKSISLSQFEKLLKIDYLGRKDKTTNFDNYKYELESLKI